MLKNPVDKDEIAEEMTPLRSLFTKSVVLRLDLAEGAELREEFLTVKKPGTGIPAHRLQECVGKRLARSMKADEPLHDSDIV
jgi:N-acetylneuraminate synthase